MTLEAKKWEALKAEYLRQVETAVLSVKHPRYHDVLDDVRTHLDERFSHLEPDEQTLENMKTIIEEMGPALDYAELLDAESASAAPKIVTRNQFRVGLIYGGVFILSLFLAFCLAFNFQDFDRWFRPLFLPLLVPVLVIQLIVFGGFGFYHGWGRPFWKILVADWVGNFFFVGGFFVFGYVLPRKIPSVNDLIPFEQFPQVIFLLDWFCILILVLGISLVGKRVA